MADSVQLSVVCPFFNEEAIIEAATLRMLHNLREQFGASGWELILVNDGSVDQSLELLSAVVADRAEPVRILSLPRNQGRGRALKTGIDVARGELIVTTEVDCSWGDDIVKRLVNRLEQRPEVDFVVASPHLSGGGLVNVAPMRVFLTRIGNLLIRLFFHSDMTMNTGMTRGYRRHVIQPLVALENGKEFHLEVLLKLLTIGFRVDEIPATLTWLDHRLARRNAAKRKSSTRIRSTISSHLRFLAIAQPLRYFARLSVLCLVGGTAFMAAALWMLLTHGAAIFLALVAFNLFLFCLLFLGFSVVFSELRETMKESWIQMYPLPHPPTAVRAIEVYPRSSEE
jgi:glycosyltransferase involved in cell wall biosynthesis